MSAEGGFRCRNVGRRATVFEWRHHWRRCTDAIRIPVRLMRRRDKVSRDGADVDSWQRMSGAYQCQERVEWPPEEAEEVMKVTRVDELDELDELGRLELDATELAGLNLELELEKLQQCRQELDQLISEEDIEAQLGEEPPEDPPDGSGMKEMEETLETREIDQGIVGERVEELKGIKKEIEQVEQSEVDEEQVGESERQKEREQVPETKGKETALEFHNSRQLGEEEEPERVQKYEPVVAVEEPDGLIESVERHVVTDEELEEELREPKLERTEALRIRQFRWRRRRWRGGKNWAKSDMPPKKPPRLGFESSAAAVENSGAQWPDRPLDGVGSAKPNGAATPAVLSPPEDPQRSLGDGDPSSGIPNDAGCEFANGIRTPAQSSDSVDGFSVRSVGAETEPDSCSHFPEEPLDGGLDSGPPDSGIHKTRLFFKRLLLLLRLPPPVDTLLEEADEVEEPALLAAAKTDHVQVEGTDRPRSASSGQQVTRAIHLF